MFLLSNWFSANSLLSGKVVEESLRSWEGEGEVGGRKRGSVIQSVREEVGDTRREENLKPVGESVGVLELEDGE